MAGFGDFVSALVKQIKTSVSGKGADYSPQTISGPKTVSGLSGVGLTVAPSRWW